MLEIFKRTSTYWRNQTFNLKSLSAEWQQPFSQGLSLYQQYQTQYYDGPLMSKQQWQQQFKHLKSSDASVSIQNLRKFMKAYKQQQHCVKQSEFRASQSKSLNEGLFERLIKLADSDYKKLQLEELAYQWKIHGNLAPLSDKTLTSMYKVLQVIKKMLEDASQELQKRKRSTWLFQQIPPKAFEEYGDYLFESLTWVKLELRRICESALMRLHIAALNHDLCMGDMVINTIKKLKKLKVINAEFAKKSMLYQQVSPLHFKKLQSIVFESGSASQISRLVDMPWFNCFGVFQTETLAFQNKSIAPKHMIRLSLANQFGVSHLVPESSRKPTWLFQGNDIRYHFFDDINNFAAQILKINEFEDICATATDKNILKRFLQEASAIEVIYKNFYSKIAKDIYKTNNPFKKFFFSKTLSFLQILQVKVSEKQQKTKTLAYKFLQDLKEKLNHQLMKLDLEELNALFVLKEYEIFQDEKFINLIEAIAKISEPHLRKQQEEFQFKKNKALFDMKFSKLLQRLEAISLSDLNIIILELKQIIHAHHQCKILQEYCSEKCKELLSFFKPVLSYDYDATQQFSNSEENYRANLLLLSKVLKIIFELGEREDIKNTKLKIDEVYYQFLLGFISNFHKKNITKIQINNLIKVQAFFIESQADNIIKENVKKILKLYKDKNFEALLNLCKREKKLLQQKFFKKNFKERFNKLEKVILNWLNCRNALNLNISHLNHINELSNRLSEEAIAKVENYQCLSNTDIAFLSLGNDKNLKNNDLVAVINILAELKKGARQIFLLQDKVQRIFAMKVLDKKVQSYCEYYKSGTALVNFLKIQALEIRKKSPQIKYFNESEDCILNIII